MSKKPIMAFVFSTVTAALSIISTLLGLLYPGSFYEETPFFGFFGQDLTVLAVGVPLLLITTWLSYRRSRRGYLAWLGVLGYFLYTYSGYAFAVSNALSLLYIVLFSLSLFALIQGLSTLDVEPINLWFSKNTPIRALAGYSVILGLLFAYAWLYPTILSFFNGKVPEYAAFLGIANSVSRVLDLGIVCPLAIIIGILLWKRRSLGYALISFFLFKGIGMSLAVLVSTWLSVEWRAANYNTIIFFGLFTVVALILCYMFFRNLREETIKSYHDRSSVTYF